MKTLIKSLAVLVALAGCNVEPDPCAGGGTATVKVKLVSTISGAKVSLSGPGGATKEAVSTDTMTTIELVDVPSGRWTTVAQPYATPDARVRTAYGAAPQEFCVGKDATYDLTVAWSAIETSGKLWAINGNNSSGALLGFRADDLRSSTTASAVNKGAGPFGKDIAFDKDGNVWTHGATTADAMIIMTTAAHMAGSEPKTADRSINIAGVNCLPGATGLTFDKAGNLWLSSACMNKVYRVTAEQLRASGEVAAGVVLGGLMAPTGLAFDGAGNLYVADQDLARIVRFDAASLSASTTTPSALISVRRNDDPLDTTVLAPSWLAFDKNGTLWANDFGANLIYSVAKANLGGMGEQTAAPGVRIALQVGALLEGMAFDEAGGLWVAFSAGKLGRLDATQLTTSTGPGMPTAPAVVLSSGDIGSASNLGFYPAPAGLPLISSLP